MWFVEQYVAYTDEWVVKRKHNMGDLIANLNQYMVNILDPKRIMDHKVINKQMDTFAKESERNRELAELKRMEAEIEEERAREQIEYERKRD